MCFSAESSFLAWTLAYSISYYLFNRNHNYDRWNAAFIMVFSTIQLLEAGIWSDPSQNIKNLLTRLIFLTLLLQPLIQTHMGYKYTGSSFLYIMSFVYLAIFLWGILKITTSKASFHTTLGPNGHLAWHNKDNQSFLGNGVVTLLYLLGLFVPLLFMKNFKWVPLIAIGLVTAFISYKYSSTKEFGSYWCFTAVAYAIVALFV
jgi:hypothetical protein